MDQIGNLIFYFCMICSTDMFLMDTFSIKSITLKNSHIKNYFKNQNNDRFKKIFTDQYNSLLFIFLPLEGITDYKTKEIIIENELGDYRKKIETVLRSPHTYFRNFTITGYAAGEYDTVLRSPHTYFRNFTMTGYAAEEYDFIYVARKNFMTRYIQYSASVSAPICPQESFFKAIFGQTGLLEKQFRESHLKYEQEKSKGWKKVLEDKNYQKCVTGQTPIFSVTMPDLHHFTSKKQEQKSVGIVYASGLNFETTDTLDYKFFKEIGSNNQENMKKAMEIILFERVSLWIEAALAQMTEFRHINYIIIPRIGLGAFARCYDQLQCTISLEQLYYETYAQVICQKAEVLHKKNVRIVFHNYERDPNKSIPKEITKCQAFIQNAYNEQGFSEHKKAVFIYSGKASIYETAWLEDLDPDQKEKSYFSVIIHAGDNHSYFNNGCLADESMEKTASLYDPTGHATNILPWGPNFILGAFFHKKYGMYAVCIEQEKKIIESILRVAKVILVEFNTMLELKKKQLTVVEEEVKEEQKEQEKQKAAKQLEVVKEEETTLEEAITVHKEIIVKLEARLEALKEEQEEFKIKHLFVMILTSKCVWGAFLASIFLWYYRGDIKELYKKNFILK
jgi:hypothetical protein